MEPDEVLRDLSPHDPLQRERRPLEERHLVAEGSGMGRDLLPDESSPHEHHPTLGLERVERLLEAKGVIEGAHCVDASHRLGPWEAAERRTSGDHHRICGDAAAICKLDAPCACLEPHCADSEPKIETQLSLLVAREQRDALRIPLAVQELLGQRWPVIGSMELVTDQRDRSLESFRPKRLGTAQAGQRGADDGDAAVAVDGVLH